MSHSILKPPRLRKGETIGLISPASPPSSSEKIEKSVRYLERLGYRVAVGSHVMEQKGYLAGSDQHRADDFNQMVRDKNIKAILAIRGGYGTPRILPLLDYSAVKRNPKIIVGYSDLTALQLALYRKTNLITFSGPMAGVEMWNSIDPYTEEHFWRIVTSASPAGALPPPADSPPVVFHAAKAAGRLLGGNLSLLISALSTPYSPSYKDSLLVLEEVDEAPHRVDRMLTQLFNAGVFKGIAGLLLGHFTDCNPADPSKPFLTTDEVLTDVVARLAVPVLTKLQYGHIPKKLTLPIGARACLFPDGRLELLESAVR